MQVSRFIKLLEQKIEPSNHDLSLLNAIVQEHPYCFLAHALIAQTAYQVEEDGRKDIVQRAATYAVDRGYFKKWLERKIAPVPLEKRLKTKRRDQSSWSPNGYLACIAKKSIQESNNHKSIQQFAKIDTMLSGLFDFDPFLSPFSLKEPAPMVDLAQHNASFNPHHATELLAKLMVHQKKYKRAIEIYQQLILKYPEKKAYFSGVISTLENKQ